MAHFQIIHKVFVFVIQKPLIVLICYMDQSIHSPQGASERSELEILIFQLRKTPARLSENFHLRHFLVAVPTKNVLWYFILFQTNK